MFSIVKRCHFAFSVTYFAFFVIKGKDWKQLYDVYEISKGIYDRLENLH